MVYPFLSYGYCRGLNGIIDLVYLPVLLKQMVRAFGISALKTQALPVYTINTTKTNILPAHSSCQAATLIVNTGFVSGCCGLVHVLEWEFIKGSDAQAFSKEKMPVLATARNNTRRTDTNF